MTRIGRILVVTLGLVLTGATVGAVLGGAILLGWVAVANPHGAPLPIVQLLKVGAFFGAWVGAIIAPIASWTLLRRVPLGRAIAGAAIGTTLGAIIGSPLEMIGPLLGGVGGFVAAAVYLRVIVAPRLARQHASSELRGEADSRMYIGE
jgi:hypothetical protein